MDNMDLTIQVVDLSPKVTLTDLNIFFSYCGSVEKITLARKEDQSQLALVTFRQPYAFRTALLLNDAVIVDRQVQILPSQGSTSMSISTGLPISHKKINETKDREIDGTHTLNAVAFWRNYIKSMIHLYSLSNR